VIGGFGSVELPLLRVLPLGAYGVSLCQLDVLGVFRRVSAGLDRSNRTEVTVAQHVETRLVDDLDGSEADETVTFALAGRQYEIDLSGENAAKLRDSLASFVAAARRSGGRQRPTTTTRTGARAASAVASDREHTAAVREWARQNGHEISDRGRIPNSVLEAYEQRNAAPSSATEEAPAERRKSAPAVANPFAVGQ
jgi:Lsr2